MSQFCTITYPTQHKYLPDISRKYEVFSLKIIIKHHGGSEIFRG